MIAPVGARVSGEPPLNSLLDSSDGSLDLPIRFAVVIVTNGDPPVRYAQGGA